MSGAKIAYAEVDGIPVCLAAGRWCEREAGHDGPHVFAPNPNRGDTRMTTTDPLLEAVEAEDGTL